MPDTLSPAADPLRPALLRLVETTAKPWNVAAAVPVVIPPPGPDEEENKMDGQDSRGAAALLAEIVNDTERPLFYDTTTGTAFIGWDGEAQILDPKNKALFNELLVRSHTLTNKLIGPASIGNLISYLAGLACQKGTPCHPTNCTAGDSTSLWWDGGPGRPAVKITPGQWELTPAPLAMFRRFKHQLPSPEPIRGGDPWLLFRTTNISPAQQLLALVALITDFVHGIPHPLSVYKGQQGGAKTTTAVMVKFVKGLSSIGFVNFPRKEEELPLFFYRYKNVIFDNPSLWSNSVCDMLCVAVSGGAFEKRTLHTDLDATVIQENPVISVTTIGNLHNRGDLWERSITFNLERIPPECRRSEKDTWGEFYENLPSILGGVFDALAAAMAIFPTVKLDNLPRMADFATWGYAVAEALGGRGDEFLSDYVGSGQQQTLASLETNTFAGAIVSLIDAGESLEGTFGEVVEKLREHAKPAEKDNTFPSAKGFRNALDRILPNLDEMGIEVNMTRPGEGRTSRGKGHVVIRKRIAAAPPVDPVSLQELAGLVFGDSGFEQ
jgi:hypothetical protein